MRTRLTKADLYERNELLSIELRKARERMAALEGENQRLSASLSEAGELFLRMEERYQKLTSYIESLRGWMVRRRDGNGIEIDRHV